MTTAVLAFALAARAQTPPPLDRPVPILAAPGVGSPRPPASDDDAQYRRAFASTALLKAILGMNPRTHDRAIDTEGEANHPCETWRWRGHSIHPPATVLRSIRLETGTLTAVDRGEWGGGLQWSSSSGTSQTLLTDNVSALEPIEGGALALAGLAHMEVNYGYVVRARLTATGWKVGGFVRLPGRFSTISTIAPDSYAAWSDRRVVIFSEHGILGLAECQR